MTAVRARRWAPFAVVSLCTALLAAPVAAQASDADGVGAVSVDPGESIWTQLPVASDPDVQAAVVVTSEQPSTGGLGVWSSVQVRAAGGNAYRATLRFATNGKVTLRIDRTGRNTAVLALETLLATNYLPGDTWRIELRAAGEDSVEVSARAWKTDSATPDWQLEATDASDARLTSAGRVEILSASHWQNGAAELVYDTVEVTPLAGDGGEPAPTPSPTSTGAPVDPQPTVPPTPPVEPPVQPPVTPEPGDGDGTFTIAVYPDTQQEVGTDSRFVDRTSWLVSHADDLDLRFVDHTGDVVNWDTDTHDQYEVASAAMKPLEIANIPYSLTIGNHDTLATGPGGGARDSKLTRQYQRDTTTFNSYFTAARFGAVTGAFEPGKVDNIYSTFSAEGKQWLVLSLELWPRLAVVDWANQVIASHPTSNVIISTHSYLNAAGAVDNGCALTRCSYGDASPQYLYDNLVSKHANIVMVLSGHVGNALTRTVTTPAGAKVVYYLTAIHSNTTNPVRLVTIDVDAGTASTRVFGVKDSADFGDTNTQTGLTFVG